MRFNAYNWQTKKKKWRYRGVPGGGYPCDLGQRIKPINTGLQQQGLHGEREE